MKHRLNKLELKISWAAQLIAALIMCETLFYKFTGAEESVYIFSAIGIEPWGRYLVGSLELIASLLLVIPVSAWIGAILTSMLMTGALFFHLTILGFEVKEDKGELFILALLTLLCAILILFLRKSFLTQLLKQHETN